MSIQPSQIRKIDDHTVAMPCSECGDEFQSARASTVTICRKCRTSVKSVGDVMKSNVGTPEIEKVCVLCGQNYSLPGFYGIAAEFSNKCPICVENLVKEETKADLARSHDVEQVAKRRRKFEEIYPFESWTVADKLPNPEMLRKVMGWNLERKKGLFLHGPSRGGKSRCIWQLAEREFMAGRSFAAIDSGFGYKYASMFSKDAAWVEKWIKDLIAVDILLADDIFKIKVTDSAEQALFYVTDKRTENDRVTWWTTNDSAASLSSRLGPDRGPALMERIKETCDAIAFTRGAK